MPQFDKSIQTFYKYHPRNYNHSQHPNFLFKNYHIFGDFQFQESEISPLIHSETVKIHFFHSAKVKIHSQKVKIHITNTTIHPQPQPSSKSFFLFSLHIASLGMHHRKDDSHRPRQDLPCQSYIDFSFESHL